MASVVDPIPPLRSRRRRRAFAAPPPRPRAMFSRRRCIKKVENVEDPSVSLLDLPELALEAILAKLPAATLSTLGSACRELRNKCQSNHLWQKLLYDRWGKVAGKLAYVEWQHKLAAPRQEMGLAPFRAGNHFWIWPFSCILPVPAVNLHSHRRIKAASAAGLLPQDSLMAWYWALESGSFWFPAQVYNRENGHVGFMLSCYDAEVSYDCATDSFRARYPPHGHRSAVIEEGVEWERVRAPPVETAAHELHVSDCLEELRPGDHIEVQWRRNKDFPYGWWYGVVGHVASCDRRTNHCRCALDDTIWLEFNQYTVGSRWRRAPILRLGHREEGNDAEGFYGGVRKLRTKDEISIWSKLWPKQILE